MALIDEVKAEVIQRNTGGVQPVEQKKETAPEPKKTRRRKNPEDMTKEEREAWLAKKRAEEEARYLGQSETPKRRKSAEANGPSAKVAKKSIKAEKPAVQAEKQPLKRTQQSQQNQRTQQTRQTRQTRTEDAKRPKILQPLEVLYLLRIPGLPKGDCLAICYARGADQ